MTVEADTLVEGDWIELDRLDGNGPQAFHIATVEHNLANEDLGTPEEVRFTYAATNTIGFSSTFAPAATVTRLVT